MRLLTSITTTVDFGEEEEKGDSDNRGISDSDSDGNLPLRATDEWLENKKHNIDIMEDEPDEIFGPPEIDNQSLEHTELPWQCEDCEKRFATEDILYQHTATHGNGHRSLSASTDKVSDVSSKSQPYSCVYPGCPRSFARPYDLDRHMKVHLPRDKYDCPQGLRGGDFCKRVGENGFLRKDHLFEHLRKVHMVDLPKSARGTRS